MTRWHTRPDPRRSTRRGWARYVLALLLLPACGLGLVVGGEMVPDAPIVEELSRAVHSGALTTDQRTTTYFGYTIDHLSECVALTIGLGDGDQGLFEAAMRNPTLGGCPSTVSNIEAWQQGASLTSEYDYLRYWHGHIAYIRPVVAVVGLAAMRASIFGLLVASLTVFAVVLRRRITTGATVLFLTPVLLGTDLLATPWAGPHGVAAVVVFLSATMVLWAVGRDDSLLNVALVSSVSAGVLVLVDVLSMATLSWVLTTSMVGLMCWTGGKRERRLLAPMLVAAGAWVVGFTTTWVSKWVLAGFVVGFDEVYEHVFRQVVLRTTGDADYVELGPARTTAVALGTWLESWIGVVITIIVLAVLIRVGRQAKALGRECRATLLGTWALLSAPAGLAVVWFEVMQNHSQVHRWLTPRGVGMAAAVLLMAAELTRADLAAARAAPPGANCKEPPSA